MTCLLRAYTSGRSSTTAHERRRRYAATLPALFRPVFPAPGAPTVGSSAPGQRFPGACTPPPPGKLWGGAGRAERVWPWQMHKPWCSRAAAGGKGTSEKRKEEREEAHGTLCTPPSCCVRKTDRAAQGEGNKAGPGTDNPASPLTTVRARTSSSLRPRGIPGAPDPAGGAEQRGSLFKGSNKGSRKNKRDGN